MPRRSCKLHKKKTENKVGKRYDFVNCQKDTPKNTPQQLNNNDCGVFMLTIAEYISREAKPNFGQQNIPYLRQRMAYEILTKEL